MIVNRTVRTAFGAMAILMLTAGNGRADLPASSCDVTFSLLGASTLGALQFRVAYSAAGGEFTQSGTVGDCTTTIPNASIAKWDDYSGPKVLHFAAVSVDGMTGPAAVGHCTFESALAPAAADFQITMEDGAGLEVDGNAANRCGAPVSGEFPPYARDGYVVLRKAVGHMVSCDLCECDTDDDGSITSSDALRVVRAAAGENVGMTSCPDCSSAPVPNPVTTSEIVTAALECSSICPPALDATCGTGEKSSFALSNVEDGANDSFKWKMSSGSATMQASLGDPVTATSYLLCVYDSFGGEDSLVAQYIVDPNNKWIDKDPDGLFYKDPSGSADGVTKVQIRTGDAGSSRFAVSGKGPNLVLPPAMGFEYFSQAPRVVVQLHNSASTQCWSSEFTTFKSSTSTKFSAKTP